MDGSFVPNISIGLPVVKAIRPLTTKPLDVHLMIVNPDNYLQAFRDAGADIITVHAEACTHLDRTIQAIRQTGAKAGAALNPHTPEHVLEYVLPMLDLVLVMTVNPGFGGQSLIERVFPKMERIRKRIDSEGLSTLIEVDGGRESRECTPIYKCWCSRFGQWFRCIQISKPHRNHQEIATVLILTKHDFVDQSFGILKDIIKDKSITEPD